jgi:hypothetical protein
MLGYTEIVCARIPVPMRANPIGLLAIAAFATALPAAADGVRGVLNVGPVYQGSANPEAGGVASSGTLVKFGAAGHGSGLSGGLAANYDAFESFSRSASVFGTAAPWESVSRAGLSAPISYRDADGWSYQVVPSFDFFREDGASLNNSLSYGALLAVSKQFTEKRRIGLGIGVYDTLAETRAYPYVLVDWEFNERWRLTNPLAVGPVGPAGLELRYRVDSDWELGAGGAYRSYRFRLNNAGAAPGGIGEERGFAAFVRLGRDFGPRYSVDFYAGAVLDGEFTLSGSSGDELLRTKFDSAPLMGVTFTGRF